MKRFQYYVYIFEVKMGCFIKRGNVIFVDRCEVKKNFIYYFKLLYLLYILLDFRSYLQCEGCYLKGSDIIF